VGLLVLVRGHDSLTDGEDL
jgi:hypothetical protein